MLDARRLSFAVRHTSQAIMLVLLNSNLRYRQRYELATSDDNFISSFNIPIRPM